MVRTQQIVMRVDPAIKSRLEEAANKKGVTLTTLVMDAAEKAARRVERQSTPSGVLGGVPTFFRGCVVEAQRGGDWGYQRAGYHLATHLCDQIPHDVGGDEWGREIQRLTELPADEDVDAVWEWFHEHYPKCMALVPSRRKGPFYRGVCQVWDGGGIG